MRVLVPDALQSYTQGQRLVHAHGTSLDALLYDLDAQYPGLRFRVVNEQDQVRRHIVMIVGGERTEDLQISLQGINEVVILQALSGG